MRLPHLLFVIVAAFFLSSCAHLNPDKDVTGNSFNYPGNNNSNRSNNPAIPNRKREDEEDSPTQSAANNANKGSASVPTDNSSCTSGDKGGTCCDFPHWLNTAKSFFGLHEGRAATGENAKVRAFLDHAGVAAIHKTYNSDGAWCAALVYWCLKKTNNPKTGKPYPATVSAPIARARNWKTYGKTTKPCFGAIMIVHLRKQAEDSGYHATICVGKFKYNGKNGVTTGYIGLGGNQGNMVKYSPYDDATYEHFFVFPDDYKPCKEHYDMDGKFFYSDWASIEALNNGTKSSSNESTR